MSHSSALALKSPPTRILPSVVLISFSKAASLWGKRWKTSPPHNEPKQSSPLDHGPALDGNSARYIGILRSNKSTFLVCPIRSWAVALLCVFAYRIWIMLLDFWLSVTLSWKPAHAQNQEHEPNILFTDSGPYKGRATLPNHKSLLCARVCHNCNTKCFGPILTSPCYLPACKPIKVVGWNCPRFAVFSRIVRMANFHPLELTDI